MGRADAAPPLAPLDDRQVAAVFDSSGAAHWGLSRAEFAEALRRSCAHRFGTALAATDAETVRRYVAGLHTEDLALATACRLGRANAWEHVASQVLPVLRVAARAMAGDSGEALAEVLLADLYGTSTEGAGRRPLLDYFHGRSRLTTWLRTVLAQRHVDAWRSQRRTVPLETAGQDHADGSPAEGLRPEVESAMAAAAGPPGHRQAADADRPVVLAAFERELQQAVARLPAADRLRLSLYYLHRLTLAGIARLTHEHESTVSRKLDRSRQAVREGVEEALRTGHRFADADLQQCYDEAVRHGSIDLAELLKQEET
jgi:RNA polymerase sigma-70 factor (ECF subfamily)